MLVFFVGFFHISVLVACFDFLLVGRKVTPMPYDMEGRALSGRAAETRYGDRRFSGEHVQHLQMELHGGPAKGSYHS